jgi:hypothetical protein
MESRAHELDTVRLLREVDGWPAGTIGAVVSEYPATALVEVAGDGRLDEHGLPERDLFDGLVSVPYGALAVVERAASRTA